MINKLIILIISVATVMSAAAQANDLPIREWKLPSEKPFVFYISGDGGLNDFSTNLCKDFNTAGYQVSALNAKTYFWGKKSPEKTTADIAIYLAKQLQDNTGRKFILAGYSFGSDIIPFIVNRLPENIRKQLVSVVLLSPSASTDFEVHYSDMLGMDRKRSMDVVAEINRMGDQNTATIYSAGETSFPMYTITLKNHSAEVLPGGHHFEGNTNEVANYMMKYFK
jgi:type IV secretory pathway VirJ component